MSCRYSPIISMRLASTLVVLACSWGGLAEAQILRQLSDIKVHSTLEGERVVLYFNAPYTDIPVKRSDAHGVTLVFEQTGNSTQVSNLVSRESLFINKITLSQSPSELLVSIGTASPALNENIRYVTKGNEFQILIGDKSVASVANNTPAEPVLGAGEEDNFYGQLLLMGMGLLGIVGALYAVLWLFKKFVFSRRILEGRHPIRLVSSFYVSSRQRIMVVEIDDELLVLGSTPQQITMLHHLGRAGGLPPSSPPPSSLQTAAPNTEPPTSWVGGDNSDTIQKFAQRLRDKIKDMKDIK